MAGPPAYTVASDIVISSVAVMPTIGLVGLKWSVSDDHLDDLPYRQLDAVEVWSATTNDRATSSKVAEGITSALHIAVEPGGQRYYWFRARTKEIGNAGERYYGAFYPSGANAGKASNGLASDVTSGAHTLTVNFTCNSFGVGYSGGIEIWYGDGSKASVVIGSSSALDEPMSHNYTVAGTYTAYLIANPGGRQIIGVALIHVT